MFRSNLVKCKSSWHTRFVVGGRAPGSSKLVCAKNCSLSCDSFIRDTEPMKRERKIAAIYLRRESNSHKPYLNLSDRVREAYVNTLEGLN